MPNNKRNKKPAQANKPSRKPKQDKRRRPARPGVPRAIMSGISEDLKNYISCRVNPFSGPGGAKIPDGANSNFISVDTKTVDIIACSATANAFCIQTLPCLPALAMISANPGATLSLNGTNVAPPSSITPIGTSTTAWSPISIPQPYLVASGGYTPGVALEDPYHSSKARMVSVGYKLTYTGPAQTCAGAITVTPNPVSFSSAGSATSGVNPALLQSYSVNVGTTAGVRMYTSGLGTQILVPDVAINPTGNTRQSQTFRPEDGVIIIPRHKTAAFDLKPTLDVPAAMVAGFNNSITLPFDWFSTLANTHTQYRGGIVWYDDDWDSYLVSATGLNVDASFRWETVLCMEYNPQMSSTLSSFTQNKSPEPTAITAQAIARLESQMSSLAVTSGRPAARSWNPGYHSAPDPK